MNSININVFTEFLLLKLKAISFNYFPLISFKYGLLFRADLISLYEIPILEKNRNIFAFTYKKFLLDFGVQSY